MFLLLGGGVLRATAAEIEKALLRRSCFTGRPPRIPAAGLARPPLPTYRQKMESNRAIRPRKGLDRRILEVDFRPTFLGSVSTMTHVYERLSEPSFLFLGSSRRALSRGGTRRTRRDI